MDVNERWAYRERGRMPMTEVVILAESKKPKPTRIKVRFLDDESEGAEDWTPINRLQCLWADRDEFLLQERELDALVPSPLPDNDEITLSMDILQKLAPEFTFVHPDKHGILKLSDVEIALRRLQWSKARLLDSAVFREGRYLIPWPVGRQVIERLLRLYPRTTQDFFTELRDGVQDARDAESRRHMVDTYRLKAERYVQMLEDVERDHVYTRMIATLSRLAGEQQTEVERELNYLRTFRVGALAALRDTLIELESRKSMHAVALRDAVADLLDREQAGLLKGKRDRPRESFRYLR